MLSFCRRKVKGFTLVELIVVISILAILSTISFIAYTNMSSDARNSVRKTDMGEMKVRLRGIAQKLGAFPLPSTPITLSNSGTAYVSQGWSDTIETDNGSSFRADPKTSKAYLYATTTNRQGYQIGMTMELGSDKYSSYVDGDYTPLAPYVFPSLLLGVSTAGNFEIKDGFGAGTANRAKFIVNNGTLNLPYDMNGKPVGNATTFSGVITEPNVRLPWASNYPSCEAIYEAGKSMWPWDYLIVSSTGALTLTGCTMLEAAGPAAYSSGATYVASQVFTYNGATVTVTATDIGTSNTKADSACDTNDIVIWDGGTDSVQVWSACNVGATTTAGYNTVPVQPSDPSATLPGNRVAAVQGNYYQWGRNDNVTSGTWTTSQWTSQLTPPANTTANTNFYEGDWSYGDWYNYSSQAGSSTPVLWNIANGGNNQGPCSSGYHIPTNTEWLMLQTIINSSSTFGSCSQVNFYDRLVCTVKLPYAGYRWNDGTYGAQGTYGYYWSSTPDSSNSYNPYFVSSGGNVSSSFSRGNGFSLRCLKN